MSSSSRRAWRSRKSTTCACWPRLAISSGVRPSSDGCEASARAAMRHLTTFRCPFSAAMWYGVLSLKSTAPALAGSCWSSNSTMACRPLEATRWMGAAPWLSRMAASARSARSCLHNSALPRDAARCNGVRNQYCSNTQFMSAPACAKGLSMPSTLCWMQAFSTWLRASAVYPRNHEVTALDGRGRDDDHPSRLTARQVAAHLAQSTGRQKAWANGRIISSSSNRLRQARLYD
mmetsp:Transcript_91313/g.254390  ORF Transcript_91313/g.254390 Transcript_91313/m.254390 type:complete len:233 (+) Transcript_91313:470-1168(+)